MKKILSYFSILAIIVAAGYFGKKIYYEYKRDFQIKKEIDAVKAEAEKVSRNNDDLREKITFFESPEFQEWEAKKKLNFQLPEESVAVIKPSHSSQAVDASEPAEAAAEPAENIPNWKKWWNYFFKH